MQVPFSKKAEQNEDVTLTPDVKPAALSAFLNPPSRLINFNQKNQLSPQQISQKVASLLKPGPPFYSEVSSSDLIENLSNGSLMRCDDLRQQIEKDATKKIDDKGWFKGAKVNAQQEGEQQQVQPWTGVGTVWSALDSLPSGNAVFAVPAVSADGKIETTSTKDDQGDDGLWSAIMFSCDLDGKNVELTKSCVVPTHVLNTHHYYNGNKSALFASIGAGSTYKWDDWSNEQSANVSVASLLALYTNPTLEAWQWPSWVPFLGKKDDEKDDKPTPKPEQPKGSKRVWVPSTTKVSVRANWWGYTIYIPQSVFPNLDSDVEQAEKIANIVHTVLTTILDKASSLPIPAALQAALLVLKAIAPSTSYISTFIGWSWDEIKSFNKGQGVELSATWLLPIALIPHTWDAAVAPPDQNDDGKPDGPPTTQPPATVPQTGGNTDQPAPSQPQTGGDNDQPAPSQPQPVGPAPTVPAPADPAPEKPNPKDPQSDAPQSDAPQSDVPQPAVPVSEGPKQEEPASKQPTATEPVTAEPTAPQIPAQSPQEHATLPSAPSTTTPPALEQPAVPAPAPTPAPAPAPQAPSNDDNTISGDPLGRGKLDLPSIGDAPAQTPAAENDGIEWQGQPAEPAAPAATTSSTTEPAEPAITELSTTEAKSSEKVKDGKRKLFGKISNRV